MLELRPIALLRPVLLSGGEEGVIVLRRVVLGIEEILHIVAHDTEELLLPLQGSASHEEKG